MKAKQRTEITYEAHETTVIRYGGGQDSAYCPLCRMYTAGLSAAQAISIMSLTPHALENSISAGLVHSIETAAGPLTLCGNSLRLLLLGENTDE